MDNFTQSQKMGKQSSLTWCSGNKTLFSTSKDECKMTNMLIMDVSEGSHVISHVSIQSLSQILKFFYQCRKKKLAFVSRYAVLEELTVVPNLFWLTTSVWRHTFLYLYFFVSVTGHFRWLHLNLTDPKVEKTLNNNNSHVCLLGRVRSRSETSEKADCCYSNGCPDGHNTSTSSPSLYMGT